jgi:hypothetical protein
LNGCNRFRNAIFEDATRQYGLAGVYGQLREEFAQAAFATSSRLSAPRRRRRPTAVSSSSARPPPSPDRIFRLVADDTGGISALAGRMEVQIS